MYFFVNVYAFLQEVPQSNGEFYEQWKCKAK